MLILLLKWLAEQGIWPATSIYYKRTVLPPMAEVIPTFEAADNLIDEEYFYNPDFYASDTTTQELMRRFNATVCFKKIIQDGNRYAPAQWFLRFTDGVEVNAGQIAKFFAYYPEKRYPGIAPRFAVSLIGHERGMRELRLKEGFKDE